MSEIFCILSASTNSFAFWPLCWNSTVALYRNGVQPQFLQWVERWPEGTPLGKLACSRNRTLRQSPFGKHKNDPFEGNYSRPRLICQESTVCRVLHHSCFSNCSNITVSDCVRNAVQLIFGRNHHINAICAPNALQHRETLCRYGITPIVSFFFSLTTSQAGGKFFTKRSIHDRPPQ